MPEIPMGSQLYTGVGVNSDTGGVYGLALEFDPLQEAVGGQQVLFVLESITSSRELTEKLRISASATFKAAWGVSAEFNLSNSLEINAYYTYALIRCHVINPPRLIRNPRLTATASNALIQQGWDAFAASYGWEYVAGFIEGGSYYGLIEMQTTNQTEQRNVKAKLSGHWGPFSASGEFESDLKEIQKSTTINVAVTRSGGSGGVVNTDLNGMLDEARNFPQTARTHPVQIMALTSEYLHTVPLPNIPAPNSLPRLAQRDTLNDLGRAYLRLRDYKSGLDFVNARSLSDFDEYRDLDASSLADKATEFEEAAVAVVAEIDKVVRQGQNCAADIAQCQAYALNWVYPKLPTIGGDLLNIQQLEDKLAVLESYLTAHGRLGGGVATFDTSAAVARDLTVGAGGDGKLVARSVDGKQAGNDTPDALHLNFWTGKPVHVGGGSPADLAVHGDVTVDGGVVASKAVVSKARGGTGDLTVEGDLHGVRYVNTWDVRAGGGLYVGTEPYAAHIQNNGVIVGTEKRFSIDHPLRPNDARLIHAAIEGPEAAVYYRGQGTTQNDGCTEVLLPHYFEALVRPAGRTVLVTPVIDESGDISPLAVSDVCNGRFVVRTADGSQRRQRFFWEVKGIRKDVDPLQVEMDKRG